MANGCLLDIGTYYATAECNSDPALVDYLKSQGCSRPYSNRFSIAFEVISFIRELMQAIAKIIQVDCSHPALFWLSHDTSTIDSHFIEIRSVVMQQNIQYYTTYRGRDKYTFLIQPPLLYHQ